MALSYNNKVDQATRMLLIHYEYTYAMNILTLYLNYAYYLLYDYTYTTNNTYAMNILTL